MPSNTKKQQQFFYAVKRAKHDPKYGDERLQKVAKSMSDKDIDDFTKKLVELKVKKAILGVLKDVREPMYLQEDTNNAVANEFNVEGKFEEYVKRFMGQRLSEKELEAVNTLQDLKPSKVSNNEIRYESTDSFKNSTTTVIKKLKEGGSFVFTAFTHYTKAEKPEDQQQQDQTGGPMDVGLGGSSPIFEKKNPAYISWPDFPIKEAFGADPLSSAQPAGITPAMGSQPSVGPLTSTAPMTGTPKTPEQEKKEKGIDDILVRKSLSYNDEIKGGAILIDFLKKLDL